MADFYCGNCDVAYPAVDLPGLKKHGWHRNANGTWVSNAGVYYCSNPGCLDETLIERRSAPLAVERRSVLQDWVPDIPLREQGTLLTAVRGCDSEPKMWSRTGVAYSPGRRLTAFIRWCFMNPADPREVDYEEGAFFQSRPPDPFKPSEFGHLPQHWYSHAMHALEVIGYRHPTDPVSYRAHELYRAMVHNLHLNIEERDRFIDRLSEDRIVKQTVVS